MLARVGTVMLRSVSKKVLFRDGDDILDTYTLSTSISDGLITPIRSCVLRTAHEIFIPFIYGRAHAR